MIFAAASGSISAAANPDSARIAAPRSPTPRRPLNRRQCAVEAGCPLGLADAADIGVVELDNQPPRHDLAVGDHSPRRNTGADATSLVSNRCSHSAVGCCLMISAISRTRSAALTARVRGVSNRGSSMRSGRSEAAQKPRHLESEIVPTLM